MKVAIELLVRKHMGIVCSIKTKGFCKTLFINIKAGQLGPLGCDLPTPGLNHKDMEFKDKHN